MNSIGKELKKQRELRNISLEEIANFTKISIRFLKAIEDDNFTVLPAGIYRKNFIISYANYIGINPNDILALYPEDFNFDALIKPQKKEQKRNYLFLIIIVLFIIALGILAFSMLKKSYNNLKKDNEAKVKISALPQAAEERKKENFKTENKEAAILKEEGFIIKIIAIEDTWLEIILDNEIAYDWLIKKGQEKSFNVKNKIILKKIGNAGGIIIYYNDKKLKSLGNHGQVIKNIILTNETIENYVGSN